MTANFVPNKLIEVPKPGILFTRDNAMWAYHALKAARDVGVSIPEQDELFAELAGLLFPAEALKTACGHSLATCHVDRCFLEDKMPYANDLEGMERWHHAHGLPWGKKFYGPAPVTVRCMVPAGTSQLSLPVHLANEHSIDTRAVPWGGSEVEHMRAHMLGKFRAGQEHYHGSE